MRQRTELTPSERTRQGQLFFGPLDDVDRGEDTYSPLQHESRYCASCHEGVVFGTHVYSTYSEWLASPAKRQGQSCQTCHMAATGRMSNIAPGSPLPLTSGPTLPSETGDQLCSLPGRLFGRLRADDGGRSPIPFWRPAGSLEDSRLKPEEPMATNFFFPAQTHQVRTRVLYRRFWKPVADDKLWPDDTVTVYDERRTVDRHDRG